MCVCARTHGVYGNSLQNLVLLLGLQFVDVLVCDEQASVGAFVESVYLREQTKVRLS